jgi:hypothetical protein
MVIIQIQQINTSNFIHIASKFNTYKHTTNTACTKMIGAVSSGHNGFENAHTRMFPTWNETAGIQVLIACAIPLPPPFYRFRFVRLQRENGDSEKKAFCVLQFSKHESGVSLQRAFWRQFQSGPPSANSIRRWYQQFQTTGCPCKGKSAGHPRVSEETVERVRQSFLCSPKKFVHPASRELEMSTMTVWRVLRKKLEIKSYRLHLVQFLQSFWYTEYK